MSMMSMDDRGMSGGSASGGGERGYVLEQKLFNTGSKALPTVQSHNGSASNHAPIVGEQQLGISGSTMATGDTGHVGNVTYMSSGMLGPTQFMVGQPPNTGHPSTSVMMQQPQNGGVSRSSPTEMNQCLQPMSEDSIEYSAGVNHMHQMQMQHHMQQAQYQMHHAPPTSSYHNPQHQQQMQQMHYHQQHQYQQQSSHHQMYPPQMQQQSQQPQGQQQQQPQPSQQQQSSVVMQHINESSNLSSAGSISDREPELGGTPQRPTAPQTVTTTDKKSARKRRRAGPAEEQATPKQERKITEFMKINESAGTGSGVARCLMNEYQQNQSSPKRQAPAQQNGANNFEPPQQQQQQQVNQHEMQSSYWAMATPSLGVNNRGTPTPTQQQHYSSDSNSNSNQSPPNPPQTSRLIRLTNMETQTDASLTQNKGQNVDEVAKRDRIIDDFRRQLDDSTSKHNVDRRKLDLAKDTIKRLLVEKNIIERKAIREKTAADSARIGCFKTMRTGDSFRETWVDGYAFNELDRKSDQIGSERNEISNASTLLKKRKPLGIGREPKRAASNAINAQLEANGGMQPSTSNANGNDDAIFRRPEEPKEIQYQEYIELDEIYKLRKEHLRKDETDLAMERDRLDKERQCHMRELKRAANEAASQFKDHKLLHQRYLMMSLLGKGGFSEVWKAFDIEENRYVACKIHHVNKDWKEEKKATYVKHAMREKDIHKSLDHCRIVKQYDLLTIDNHSFCTVLEYIPGNDLDFYLKQHKQVSEKEARSIIMQVVSALVYLNEKQTPIIHYDLKPANILLESGHTSGAIKITDFGLSKIMESDNADNDGGIELTSQFAGTYWYLPPETFIVHQPAMICCKVDVWSVGVIFYQMIYGKKPFGNELTQQKILEQNTIINAREVSFPNKPQVSSAAQDFIRRCLQYRKEDRADVFELAKHELFKPRGSVSAFSAGHAKIRASVAGSIASPSIPRSPSVNREDDNL